MASDAVRDEDAQMIRRAKGQLGEVIALRLPPGTDVYKAIGEIARDEEMFSGLILCAVGSLNRVTLRNFRLFPAEFPIQDRHRIFTPRDEPMELLALSGNISRRDGDVHVHAHAVISSGLEGGQVYGGHLVEGCMAYSTVELILCSIDGVRMVRKMDPQTRVVELYFD